MKKKKTTIYDLAEKTGHSPATVSRVLNHPELVNEETRNEILAAADSFTYQKRQYRSHTKTTSETARPTYPYDYLMVMPTPRNPFYGDIIEGAKSAAAQHSCHLFTDYWEFTDTNVEDYFTQVNNLTFAGIIITSAVSDAILVNMLKHTAVIQCSEYNETQNAISSVSIDDSAIEKRATEYLISIGCRKIAFMSASYQYRFAKRRLHGFQMAMQQANIPINEVWMIQVAEINFTFGYNAAMRLLKTGPLPEAILCVSDVFAAACIKAAYDLKIRVPEDLKVVGFDNTSTAIITTPSITTVTQPRFQLGYNAFEMLYQEIRHPEAQKQHRILPTELVIRGSTKI